MMTNEQKKMIKEHKRRMYHMRAFSTNWQLTHQKRWGEASLCWYDKCDCKPKKEE